MNLLRQFFKGFKKGMHTFGQNIAIIINSTLLLIVYVIGVGFTSIFAKIFRKRFLEIKISQKRNTYWLELDLKKKPIETYYRQF
jgi:hypothetical protein